MTRREKREAKHQRRHMHPWRLSAESRERAREEGGR